MSFLGNTFRKFSNLWKSLDGAAFSLDRAVYQIPQLASADRDVSECDRLTVAKQCWYFYNNVGMVKGAVNDLKRYAIGDGLRPIPQSANENWNAQALAYFDQWARVASIDGKLTWGEIEGMFSINADTKGEMFLVLTAHPSGYPAVQVIESQAIGENEDNEDESFEDGIKVTAQGRPMAYMLKESGKKIPASAVIHYAENMRPGQLHGIPTLAHATTQLFDSKDIKKNELMAGKINAAVAAVLTVPPTMGGDFLGTKVSTSSTDAAVTQFESMTGTRVMRLPIGAGFTTHSSDRPNANFIPFLDYIIRDVSTGMGLPPEFVWDSAKLGGATARLAISKAGNRARERRSLIASKVSSRVWQHVIGTAINNGDLPPQKDWWKVSFRGPASPSVDAGRDAVADINDLKIGLTNYEELYGERGEDWKLAMTQKAKEIRFAKELSVKEDIPFDQLLQLYPNPPLTA